MADSLGVKFLQELTIRLQTHWRELALPPEAIDAVLKLGMNHPMGSLALADLIGMDVVLFIMEALQRDLGEAKYRPAPCCGR